MKSYSFELILSDTSLEFEDLAEAIYEAGCDDGTLNQCDGVLNLSFDREANSLESALQSAIEQVESVGCSVTRVEIANLQSIRVA